MIHPDGGTPGTAGCVGATCGDTAGLEGALNAAVNAGDNTLQVTQ